MKRKIKKKFKIIFNMNIWIAFILGAIFIVNKGFINIEYDRLWKENSTFPISNDYAIDHLKDWNLLLVNPWNKIPENYRPNLVEISNGEKIDERIYEPLMTMLEAAKEKNKGQIPKIVSGYRTYDMQKKLYEDKVKNYRNKGYSNDEANEESKKWVALPGYSEHQLGLAVDINGATYDLYFWLQDHSYQYGFVFRYKGNKTNITGTEEEVWHYRYVGIDVATQMYEQDLCLEEYLEKKAFEN